jgi:hypothetical protein
MSIEKMIVLEILGKELLRHRKGSSGYATVQGLIDQVEERLK